MNSVRGEATKGRTEGGVLPEKTRCRTESRCWKEEVGFDDQSVGHVVKTAVFDLQGPRQNAKNPGDNIR